MLYVAHKGLTIHHSIVLCVLKPFSWNAIYCSNGVIYQIVCSTVEDKRKPALNPIPSEHKELPYNKPIGCKDYKNRPESLRHAFKRTFTPLRAA